MIIKLSNENDTHLVPEGDELFPQFMELAEARIKRRYPNAEIEYHSGRSIVVDDASDPEAEREVLEVVGECFQGAYDHIAILADINDKLASGDYEIKHEYDCHCQFDWHINDRGELNDGCSTDECWEGMSLYVGGEVIAERLRFDGSSVLINGFIVPDEVWVKMQMPEKLEQGETGNNKLHDQCRRDALVEFLMEGNYELDRDDERGFANEYTMILRTVSKPVEISKKDAEKWADDYLYTGDPVTEAFVGFMVK